MRESVRRVFGTFSAPLEGICPHMYQDVKGLVTTGIGNLIDPIQHALHLPWKHKNGTLALRAEIAAEWLRVKSDPSAARLGHRRAAEITELRLTADGISELLHRKLTEMDHYLARRFGPAWEDWNACAQLATLSMAWACGPAFRFPILEDALRRRDYENAALNCTISERGNPGVAPRNVRNRILYRNASRVQAYHLDPDLIDWTTALGVAEVDTLPELPNVDSPLPHIGNTPIMAENQASRPTTGPWAPSEEEAGSGGIIRIDPSSFMRPPPDDDPPDGAA